MKQKLLSFFSNKRNLIIISLTLILIIIISTLIYILSYTGSKPITVRVSNLTDSSATITWITENKEKGIVLYSDQNNFSNNYLDIINKKRAFDDRDVFNTEIVTELENEYVEPKNIGKYYVHHVTIKNLDPETQYYFRISDGLRVFNVEDSKQNIAYYDISTVAFFNFTTLKMLDDINQLGAPKPIYGDIKIVEIDKTERSSSDSLVFVVGMKADSNGAAIESSASLPISTITNDNGGWAADKSNLRDSSGKLLNDYVEDVDYIYVYYVNQNYPPTFGNYLKYGTEDSPTPELKYYVLENNDWRDSMLKQQIASINSLFDVIKKPVFKVNAAGTGVCCLLYISDKEKGVYDHEGTDTCPSQDCGECFPEGRVFGGGGVLCGVEEVGITDISSCQNQSKPSNPYFGCASSGEEGGEDGEEEGGEGEEDYEEEGGEEDEEDDFEEEFEPTGYCNTKLNGKYEKFAPNINKSKFVEEAKAQAAAADGKGDILAASCYDYVICKAKQQGVNPEIALNVWFHESFTSEYYIHNGTKFGLVEDLGMHCYVGNGRCPEYVGCDTPKQNLKIQMEMFTDINHTKCQTSDKISEFNMTLWGQSFWMGDCSDKYKSKGEEYIAGLKNQWNNYATPSAFPTWVRDKSKAEPNLNCDIAWEGDAGSCKPANYDGSGSGSDSEDGDTPPVDSMNGKICCAIVKKGNTVFKGDAEATANCGIFGSADQYAIQIKANTIAECEGKNYEITCKDGKAIPKGKSVIGTGYGTVPSVCAATAVKTNDIPVQPVRAFNLQNLFSNTNAADLVKNDSSDEYIVLFQENGLYDIELSGYEVKELPINKDGKYRFYLEKNNVLGFQDNADELVKVQATKIKVNKKADAFTYELKQGINFVSFPFVPTKEGSTPLKASDVMKSANINGVKVTSITYFANGKWYGGVKARLDGQNDIIGQDFTFKPGIGYVISVNRNMEAGATLNIPGKKVNSAVPVLLYKGWNLIGVNGYNNIRESSKLMESMNSLPDTSIDNITQWDAKVSRYNGYQKTSTGIYGNDFKINDKSGYFVRVAEFNPAVATAKAIYWGPGTDMHAQSGE